MITKKKENPAMRAIAKTDSPPVPLELVEDDDGVGTTQGSLMVDVIIIGKVSN